MGVFSKIMSTIHNYMNKEDIEYRNLLKARLLEEESFVSNIKHSKFKEDAKVYLATPYYQSIPFVKLKSDTFFNQKKPLLDFDIGSGCAFEQRQIMQNTLGNFLDRKTQSWGPSSPNNIDFDKLTSATQLLAEGVLEGDIAKVRQALAQNADPYMTVAVAHPNVSGDSPVYVQVPLGVAAVMLGQAKYAQDGDKSNLGSYNEVARELLVTKQGKPRIEVGNSNKTSGSAISYYARGMKWTGENAGQESNEIRNIEIPLSLRSQLLSVAGETMVENRVMKNTDGYVDGERIPDMVMREHFHDIDIPDITINSALASFRQRKASSLNPSHEEPSIKDRDYKF